jgi:hypothetical protein
VVTVATGAGFCCCCCDDVNGIGAAVGCFACAAVAAAGAPSVPTAAGGATRPGIGSPGFHPAGIGGSVLRIPAKLTGAAGAAGASSAGGTDAGPFAFFSAE